MIRIDKYSPIPIYKQIYLQVKKEVLMGRLREGEKLPTIRELAWRLNVNVNTVLKAYERLVLEGLVESQQGKGFFIKRVDSNTQADFIEDLKSLVRKMKSEGIELDLAMMLLQEVWNDEGI